MERRVSSSSCPFSTALHFTVTTAAHTDVVCPSFHDELYEMPREHNCECGCVKTISFSGSSICHPSENTNQLRMSVIAGPFVSCLIISRVVGFFSPLVFVNTARFGKKKVVK